MMLESAKAFERLAKNPKTGKTLGDGEDVYVLSDANKEISSPESINLRSATKFKGVPLN